MEVLIASKGTHRFDGDHLTSAGAQRWSGLRRFPSVGAADGHLQHEDEVAGPLTVALLSEGGALRVEGTPERVAEFMVWLTERDGLPADRTVAIYGWTLAVMPLTPGVSARDLLAVHP